LTFLLFLPVSALGEIQTITHTVKQPFGGSQSADDARISAIAKAKREALEMAGVYVEALTIVKDAKVDKDEILALAAGVLKTEVVSQENYHTKDAFGIDVVVKVVVDTSVLEGRVKKLLQDRTHLEQLNQARKKEKELLDKIAILEKENRKPTAKKGSNKDLQKQFEGVSKGLTAVDWVDKAHALWDRNNSKFTDLGKVMEYLNEAIRLNPNYADAYGDRGAAYADLGQYQLAIEDYNKAIRLQPDDVFAYNNRGIAYADLGQYQLAIEDYNKAIRLKPDHAKPYYNRGITYNKINQYQLAIEDFNKVIRLKPDHAMAYFYQGHAYVPLARYQEATEAFRQAVRINPEYADAWLAYGLGSAGTGNKTAALDAVRELRRLDPAKADELFNVIMPR